VIQPDRLNFIAHPAPSCLCSHPDTTRVLPHPHLLCKTIRLCTYRLIRPPILLVLLWTIIGFVYLLLTHCITRLALHFLVWVFCQCILFLWFQLLQIKSVHDLLHMPESASYIRLLDASPWALISRLTMTVDGCRGHSDAELRGTEDGPDQRIRVSTTAISFRLKSLTQTDDEPAIRWHRRGEWKGVTMRPYSTVPK
jgi:hypothetical protein